MNFAIFKGEKNVTELAARLFQLRGTGSKSAATEAGEALLKANPQLNEISKVPVGSIIVVPPDAPPLPAEESPAPANLVRAFAAERAQQFLTMLDSGLTDIESRASDANSDMLSLAKSKEVKAAAANSSNLAQNLPAITKSADTRLKATKSTQDARTKAIGELRKGLAQFLGN
jgi:hypothetical protein